MVLIGPMATGKSTLGAALAEALGTSQYPMDWVRWYYYLKNGYDLKHEKTLNNFRDKLTYWKPFEVDAVERIVQDFEGVIDFGAGHAHFTQPAHLSRVKAALAGLTVVLILPDPDLEKSLRICNERMAERCEKPLTEDQLSTNAEFVHSESFRTLATHTFYTRDLSPEAAASALIEMLGHDGP